MRKQKVKTSLRFQTTRTEQKNRSRKIFMGFMAIILVLAIASAALIIKNINAKKGVEEDPNNISSTLKDEVNIMYAIADGEGELVAVTRLNIDVKQNSMKVKAYSPAMRYDGKTLNDIYDGDDADTISEEELAKSFGKLINCRIDRYIIAQEQDMGKIFLNLGYYSINLENEIIYNSDEYSLHLVAGEHSLTGDEFFGYIRYLTRNGTDEEFANLSKVLADVISQHVTEYNAGRGQTIFEALADYIDTDISVNDYAKYSATLTEMAKTGNSVKS